MSTTDTAIEELDSLKRQLGSTLRSLRRERALSGEELAQMAGISQPKVSRIENGRVAPSPSDVQRIANELGLDHAQTSDLMHDAEHIAEVSQSHRRARLNGGLASIQESHRQAEALYTTFRSLSLAMFPGLVQTPRYTAGILRAALPDLAESEIQTGVLRRVERQQILEDPSRHFVFLLGEGAIEQRYTPVVDHIAQLTHARAVADQPNVSMRVLDDSTASPAPLQHDFTIYDDARVTIELTHEEIFVADPSDISRYMKQFEALLAHAPSEEESVRKIDEAVARLISRRE